MTIQTEREAFEAWWAGSMNRKASFLRSPSGIYVSDEVMIPWAAWNRRASQVAAPPAQVQESECKVCYGKGWFPNQKWIAGNGKPPTLDCWECAAPPEPAATIQDCLTVDKDSLTTAAPPCAQQAAPEQENYDWCPQCHYYEGVIDALECKVAQQATEQAELSDERILEILYPPFMDLDGGYVFDTFKGKAIAAIRAVLAAAKGKQS